MEQPLIIRVRNALSEVENPATGRSIVADGLVKGLTAGEAGKVSFTLELPDPDPARAEALTEAAKRAAQAVEGVLKVNAVATAHGRAAEAKPRAGRGGHDNPMGLGGAPKKDADALGAVKTVIAVASGKGGVGKSTVAANLAAAFARRGLTTGFLDADIHGPSAPTLFGLAQKAEVADGVIQPVEAHDLKIMSVGLLVNPEQALAWRGPMVMGALRQMMRDVNWGALDILVIDTPPGTGDAHLSLIQSKRLSGAVIVSTPQEMALADVRRGVGLFRKTDTPLIGVIENMAWLEGPGGDRQHLFGQGGAKAAAEALDAPFLGAIPLYPDLRSASDDGVILRDHPAARIFEDLADKILSAIGPPADR